MPSILDRMYGAYNGALIGWREPGARPGPDDGRHSADDFDARREAYRLFWAFYDQSAYRDARGGQRSRSVYGLYDGVRDLLGVAYQLGEFWPSYLMGGALDPAAGDGTQVPSALPVLMAAEVPAVREALAELWKRSRLQSVKETGSRFGAVLGDMFWEVCDDADAETVRMNAVNPGWVRWVDETAERNVEAYELEYYRPDPRQPRSDQPVHAKTPPPVKYNERVEPAPGGAAGFRFRTYLEGALYPWPDSPGSDYVVADLPFAPLVKVQHKDVGSGWGRPEAYAALAEMREVSDLTSCLTDWARRALFARHLMSGMKDPATDPKRIAEAARAAQTPAQLRAGLIGPYLTSQAQVENDVRTADNFLWDTNDNARAQSLVHPMPVGDVGAHVDRLRAKMVKDYPELVYEDLRMSSNASGETYRQARKPAENKIRARRVNHDEGIERAMRMALTLGALRGYEHYTGVPADAYDTGKLDFHIDGGRPAFTLDPVEENADRLAKYQAMKAAVDAGLPFDVALKEAGYNEADVAAAVAGKAKQDAAALEQIQQKQQLALADTPPGFGQ